VAGERDASDATHTESPIIAHSRYTNTDPCVSVIYPVLIKTTVDGEEGGGIGNTNKTP